ncbi:hypothetical protein F3D15_23010 [Bacteroides ovatus]|nr:hypothetical protein F3D15_23010 [Bacteroides ovatus]
MPPPPSRYSGHKEGTANLWAVRKPEDLTGWWGGAWSPMSIWFFIAIIPSAGFGDVFKEYGRGMKRSGK